MKKKLPGRNKTIPRSHDTQEIIQTQIKSHECATKVKILHPISELEYNGITPPKVASNHVKNTVDKNKQPQIDNVHK